MRCSKMILYRSRKDDVTERPCGDDAMYMVNGQPLCPLDTPFAYRKPEFKIKQQGEQYDNSGC
jgi:hypothetical protein